MSEVDTEQVLQEAQYDFPITTFLGSKTVSSLRCDTGHGATGTWAASRWY